MWKDNRQKTSSASRWDELRKSACTRTQTHLLLLLWRSNSPSPKPLWIQMAPFSLVTESKNVNDLATIGKQTKTFFMEIKSRRKKKHTVMPDIVGGALSLVTPGVEHMENRFHRAAARLFNGVVLEIRVMMVVVLLIMSSTPQRCLLVVWVACWDCGRPHDLCPPLLSVLFTRWNRRR